MNNETKEDYAIIMKRINELISINPKEGTDLYDELIYLAELACEYEEKHYKI